MQTGLSDKGGKRWPQQKPAPIILRIDRSDDPTDYRFTDLFRIGRDPACELPIQNPIVSSSHAAVFFAQDQWQIKDLDSTNGTFLNGHRIQTAAVYNGDRIQLGEDGPVLTVHIAVPKPQPSAESPEPPRSIDQYLKHYFEETDDDEAGEHTMMIRQAFSHVWEKQRKKTWALIAALMMIIIAVGAYAVFKHFEVSKQRLLAQDIFYEMKGLEIEYARILQSARFSPDQASRELVENYHARYRKLEESYDKFTNALGIYRGMDPQERVILRLSRIFGECEIGLPDGFLREVLSYVDRWKSTKRLDRALKRAYEEGYINYIVGVMIGYDLPPQFLYLALQESNFNTDACGPETRYGIAKGMWQFIPSTAEAYGLETGPLVELRRPDPADERHDFRKSTRAAARYLRKIYDTQAQASGLLTMASYNWGDTRVNRLIQKMPENPRDRNFWRFLTAYRDRIPLETYDYVFMIFSAAVICENPSLFGFDFVNPLKPALEAVGDQRTIDRYLVNPPVASQKLVWLTALAPDERAVDAVMELMEVKGIEVHGALWENDLKGVGWMIGSEELLDKNVGLWVILGEKQHLLDPDIRYGLSMLAIHVIAKRGINFPVMFLHADREPIRIDLPQPLAGLEMVPLQADHLDSKLMDRLQMSGNEHPSEFFLNVHGNKKIGQWFEVGPRKDSWNGAMFGIAGGGKIIFHVAGPRGKLPEKAELDRPLKGLKMTVGGRQFHTWAIRNRLDEDESYFVKVSGAPLAILFGSYSVDEDAGVFVTELK